MDSLRSLFMTALLMLGSHPGCGDDHLGETGPDAMVRADAGIDAGGEADAGTAPRVTIAFPPPSALTDDTAIVIRGTAEDPDGIAAIRVNGVAAGTSSSFADWQATVPLLFGLNDIVVTSEDEAGNIDDQAAITRVLRAALVDQPTALIVDPLGNRLFIADSAYDAVLSIDLDTGEPTLVSGDGVGSGPTLTHARAIAADWPGHRVFIADTWTDSILSVDLITGDRTVIASHDVGTGISLAGINGLAFEAAENRLLTAHFFSRQLLAVDVDTGDRTPLFAIQDAPRSLLLDDNRHRVIISHSEPDSIRAYDLASGAATVLSDSVVGSGPLLDFPRPLSLDLDHERLLVGIRGPDRVIAVDLMTGDRSVLSGAGVGLGPSIGPNWSIALDRAHERLLLGDIDRGAILGIDLDTGDRQAVVGMTIGRGTELPGLDSIAWDPAGDRLLVGDRTLHALVAVELTHGDRSVVADAVTGSGVNLSDVSSIALDETRALVIDAGNLLAVDLATGDRTVITDAINDDLWFPLVTIVGMYDDSALVSRARSDGDVGISSQDLIRIDLSTGLFTDVSSPTTGSGVPMMFPWAIAPDFDRQRVFVSDLCCVDDSDHPSRILEISTDSGARSVISDGGTGGVGTGPVIINAFSMLFDSANERLIVVSTDETSGQLMAVDPMSGDRKTLVGNQLGHGPRIIEAAAVALPGHSDYALVADPAHQAILAADLVTGERVIVAR